MTTYLSTYMYLTTHLDPGQLCSFEGCLDSWRVGLLYRTDLHTRTKLLYPESS